MSRIEELFHPETVTADLPDEFAEMNKPATEGEPVNPDAPKPTNGAAPVTPTEATPTEAKPTEATTTAAVPTEAKAVAPGAPIVPEPIVAPLPEPIAKEFPEAKSFDDVVTTVQSVRTELIEANKANDEVAQLFKAHPLLTETIRAIIDGKLNYREAALKVLELEDKAPDPAEDPKAFEEHLKRQIQREREAEQRQTEGERAIKQQQEGQKVAMRVRDEYQKRTGKSDAEINELISWTRSLIYGDANTGYLPSDYFDRMEAARNYKKDVEKARVDADEKVRTEKAEALKREEAARVEGKNAGVAAVLQKPRGDGLPALKGGKPGLEAKPDPLADLVLTTRDSSRLAEENLRWRK